MLGLAAACLLVLVYTYVVYPIAIGVLAKLFPQPSVTDPLWRPTVTVCIAAHNAAAVIEAKLDSVLAQVYPPERIEVIVYSDGSTDRTVALARELAKRDDRILVIDAPLRKGKPTALNRMREFTKGEVLLITDSRQVLAPDALRAMVSMLAPPQVGCVTGNLVLTGGAGSGVYWRYENWIRKAEARFRSVVGMTGPIAALRKDDLETLPADTILDDVWIPMRLRLAGRKVLFCEEAVAFDQAFDDGREFGRKVRTLAGNYQVFSRMPELLLPWRNPSWYETISHKVMRLLCPWALVGLLAATVGASIGDVASTSGWVAALWAGEFLLVGAACLGPRAGRLFGVARTFVVLHFAAMVGLWRFLTGRQKITW